MKQLTLGSELGRLPFGDVVRGLDAGEIEVLDSDGRILAYLTKVPPADASVYELLAKNAAADRDELRRRQMAGASGSPTAEVLGRLLAPERPA